MRIVLESIKHGAIGSREIVKNNLNVYLGVKAAVSMFILLIIFLYFNPYSTQLLDKEVYIIVFFILLLPSFLAFIAALVKKTMLMKFCDAWLVPWILYFSIAAMPTLQNYF